MLQHKIGHQNLSFHEFYLEINEIHEGCKGLQESKRSKSSGSKANAQLQSCAAHASTARGSNFTWSAQKKGFVSQLLFTKLNDFLVDKDFDDGSSWSGRSLRSSKVVSEVLAQTIGRREPRPQGLGAALPQGLS